MVLRQRAIGLAGPNGVAKGGPKAEKTKMLFDKIYCRNTVFVWEKRKEEENKDACKPNPVDPNKGPPNGDFCGHD